MPERGEQVGPGGPRCHCDQVPLAPAGVLGPRGEVPHVQDGGGGSGDGQGDSEQGHMEGKEQVVNNAYSLFTARSFSILI